MTARVVVAALASVALTYTDEVSLHEDMSRVMSAAGIGHAREVRLTARDRIDFLTADGVGIEVKVAGSLAAVTRQMTRYAAHPGVHELVLVTTKAAHHAIPRTLGGVPVALHSLIGQGL